MFSNQPFDDELFPIRQQHGFDSQWCEMFLCDRQQNPPFVLIKWEDGPVRHSDCFAMEKAKSLPESVMITKMPWWEEVKEGAYVANKQRLVQMCWMSGKKKRQMEF